MKKLFLLILTVLSLNAFAQIEKPLAKGNGMIAGSGSISYRTSQSESGGPTSKTTIFNISLSPSYSYFIIDNLAIGLNATISYYKQESNGTYSLGAGPIARYYLKNGLFINLETSFGYLHGLNSNTETDRFLSLKPGLGYAFFINPKVSIDPCLSYEFDYYKFDSANFSMTNKVNNILLELRISIFL
jgi:hypothetical protein